MSTNATSQYDRAIFIDLEWLCWHSPPPPGLKQEIIEIGLVEMDITHLKLVKEASYFVRPRRWALSVECEQLTGITREDILSGRPLGDVLDTITREFDVKGVPCCAWGDDFKMLAEGYRNESRHCPFGRPIDISRVFQELFLMKSQVSLSNALKMLDLPFDGVMHGALPDARNAARIHAELLRRLRAAASPPTETSVARQPLQASDFAQKLAASLEG